MRVGTQWCGFMGGLRVALRVVLPGGLRVVLREVLPGVLPGVLRVALAGALLQALSAPAQTAPAAASNAAPAAALVRPGAWNITPQAVSGLSLTYQLCFKTGSLDDIKMLMPNLQGGNGGCAAPVIEVTPGLVTWRFQCPPQALDAHARYTFTPERIEGALHLTQGTPAVSSSQSIAAQHAGACPP